MNILLISYGNPEYDGRLRELIKVFSSLGNLYLFSRGNKSIVQNHTLFPQNSYLEFIPFTVNKARRLKDIDVLVMDDRKAIIPGLILNRLLRPKKLVEDCRELYFLKEYNSFVGKVGCIIEKRGIHTSDIIICANKFRAEIMKEYYKLQEEPIVFENVRALTYSQDVDKRELEKKFEKYINDKEEYLLVATGGCSVGRKNDDLVRGLKRVKYPCRLLFAGGLRGGNTKGEIKEIEKIMNKENVHNVEFIEQLNQNELKFLLGISHIGIVSYSQLDQNGKFCASGKLYEFMYEGLPVVTTTNPPLKQLCEKEKIGVSDDKFYEGINRVIENYPMYKENVRRYAAERTVEENNMQLAFELQNKIGIYL